VILVLRVRLVELKNGKVDVDVFACFPPAHHLVARNVRAAEADKRPRQCHGKMLTGFERKIRGLTKGRPSGRPFVVVRWKPDALAPTARNAVNTQER
jgi:hypothetical protein